MAKVCIKCKKKKSLSEFYKDRGRKSGLYYYCKVCCKKIQKAYRIACTARPEHKNKIKEKNLKYNYGLTIKEHDGLYIKQNGCCAICKIAVSYQEIFTDHCHKTHKVRGLLCRRCNTLLAGVENEEFLDAAILYLRKYNHG